MKRRIDVLVEPISDYVCYIWCDSDAFLKQLRAHPAIALIETSPYKHRLYVVFDLRYEHKDAVNSLAEIAKQEGLSFTLSDL